MKIGELSNRTGASIRSLRYYEENDLLTPTRLPSGYRIYEESDVVLVSHIQALIEAGFTSAKIKQILPFLTNFEEGVELTCSPDVLGEVIAEREGLVHRITVLKDSLKAFDAVISASRTGMRQAG
ncbi:MerR family transcriptional regulator [Brevibacterium sp.]|uniref:MerR family transcriptional regulator n=1 Tax=Brevibacterium sp. TaxID=1701 RepID=UPI002810F7BB|nr:MerR family transcriptional regulator [Brevibacterium sp.]